MGPKLVERLDGSERAKQRLEVILQTITGSLTIREACERLGVGEARFHQLRSEALQAGLAELEPRPAGRPPHQDGAEAATIAELQRQVQELNAQLKTAEVRVEIAQALPQLLGDDAVKKTTQRKPARRPRPKRRKGGRKPR